MNTTKTNWYAVRAKPGTQRMARPIPLAANATYKQEAEWERRKGESILERQLRQEGIDVFMPSYWIRTKHHRTNKLIERRQPFLVGYAFVHLPRLEFERVRAVDAVMCMLAPTRTAGPVRFPENMIAQFMMDEFEADQAHKLQEWSDMERQRFNKQNHLRGQLKKVLPKGRNPKTSLREHADMAIDRLSEVVRARVLAITAQLDALEAAETLAEIDQVA
ncbi:hypothetical protein B5M44_24950 [Shinella sumterensis]|uniref:hypothetical protein n=1 Tax=Shinella sumterensis TaxID=1967501 RepID=UPI00106EABA9|nr:hypothetical protein [Shinella sumterensis]MCD1266052.1 hypothetical protein [Shinella sumterensis]TFE93520.1 hypothetical protein B5M44_24950 [Shinella sumterensis]